MKLRCIRGMKLAFAIAALWGYSSTACAAFARTNTWHVSVSLYPNPVRRGAVVKVVVQTHPHAQCLGTHLSADTGRRCKK